MKAALLPITESGEASGKGLIDGRGWQLRGLALQQLGWITPLTHQRAVEIITAAHMPQARRELVGLVAQLANRQRLAQGIPGRRGQGGDGAAQAAAQSRFGGSPVPPFAVRRRARK